MKITGVPKTAMGRLHDAVSSETLKPSEGVNAPLPDMIAGRHPCIVLENSTFNREHETYPVTLKVFLRFEPTVQNHEVSMFPPLHCLTGVLRAIDSDLLPLTETTVRKNESP